MVEAIAKVNQQHIDEIWIDDKLDRREEAELLLSLINRRFEAGEKGSSSFVLNLDAEWGRGKSFFINRLARHVEMLGHPVASVNAWKEDHADDAFIPVVASITEALKPYAKAIPYLKDCLRSISKNGLEILFATSRGMGRSVVKRLVGDEIEEIEQYLLGGEAGYLGEAIEEGINEAVEDAEIKVSAAMARVIKKFHRDNLAIENFKSSISHSLKSIGDSQKAKLPMYVFIDELDRCRPTYAIQMLERIKHIFDCENCVFLVSTDSDQLRHSIKAVYGSEFDSAGYLRRFFDRTYRFREPEVEKFISFLLLQNKISEDVFLPLPKDSLVSAFSKICKGFDLKLRDIEQCLDLLKAVTMILPVGTKIHSIYMFCVIVAHQQGQKVVMKYLSGNSLIQSETGEFKSLQEKMRRVKFAGLKAGSAATLDSILKEYVGFVGKPISSHSAHSETVTAIVDLIKAEARSLGGVSSIDQYAHLVQNAGRFSADV